MIAVLGLFAGHTLADLESLPAQKPTVPIAGAEYFLDADPGEGNGLPLGVIEEPPPGQWTLEGAAATGQLQVGVHAAFVRARDTEGVWGAPRFAQFEVVPSDSISFTQHVTAAEYYVDEVVAGSGVAMQAADGAFDGSAESLVAPPMATSELTVGTHTVYLRVIDARGRWGVLKWREFEVLGVDDESSLALSGAEYFWETDPGEGAGHPLYPADGLFDEASEDARGDAPTDMALGWHCLFVRVRDSEGVWGRPRATMVSVRGSGTDLFSGGIVSAGYQLASGGAIVTDWMPMDAGDGAFGGRSEGISATVSTEALGHGWYDVRVRTRDVSGKMSTVATSQFYVKDTRTPAADFNSDGVVDFSDFFLFADAFGRPASEAGTIYDLSGDSLIDFSDFFILADSFGSGRTKLLALAHSVLGLPLEARLRGAYPNPFNSETSVYFSLPVGQRVTMRVFSVVGARVATLIDGEERIPGVHSVTWNGRDGSGHRVASGSYLCVLTTGDVVSSRKVMLLK